MERHDAALNSVGNDTLPDLSRAPARSDMLRRSRVLLSHTLDAAKIYCLSPHGDKIAQHCTGRANSYRMEGLR